MVCLDDNNTAPDNPNQSLNELTKKPLQEREQASTPVSIVVRRFFPHRGPRFSDSVSGCLLDGRVR